MLNCEVSYSKDTMTIDDYYSPTGDLLPNYNWWKQNYMPFFTTSYPILINEVSPIYIDRGEKAYKILKALMDKKLVDIKTVRQFVDMMDELIKIL